MRRIEPTYLSFHKNWLIIFSSISLIIALLFFGHPIPMYLTNLALNSASPSTSTSISCNPSPVVIGGATACTVTVTAIRSSTTTPTGRVTFTTNSNGTFSSTVCDLAGSSGSRVASCSVDYYPLAVGTHMIDGWYSGDMTYPPSMSSRTLTVIPATTTTSVSCTPAALNLNETSTCLATVAGVDPTETSPPSGSVVFSVMPIGGFFARTSCDLIAVPAYQASCLSSFAPSTSGPQTITGRYAGDAFYSASLGNFSLNVAFTETSTSITCTQGSVIINQAIFCRATVTDSSTFPVAPIGTVGFTTDSAGEFSPTASCLLATAGSASCSVTYTPALAGQHLLTGTYNSDSTHSSSSGSATITVSQRSTSTSLTCSPLSVVANQQTTCTATVSDTSNVGGSSTPAGSVSFTNNSTGTFSATSCTLTPSSNRAASCSFSYTSTLIGNAWITASYAGDSIHTGSLYSSIISITPAPELSAPSLVIARAGSVITFRVNATDADTTRVLTLTAVPASMPSGAIFTTAKGYGTVTGIFDWVPPQRIAPGNYTLTFRVSDGQGGVSTVQVIVLVDVVSRSPTLPFSGYYQYIVLAAGGVVAILAVGRFWGRRKPSWLPLIPR